MSHLPVAVLYQAVAAPLIDGMRKPVKPGGYRDSGADIAFALREAGIPIVTPTAMPNPIAATEWVFPDTPDGIAAALAAGAGVLWANTVLFADHPIARLGRADVRLVGQVPALAEWWDDKWRANGRLRDNGLPVEDGALIGVDGAAGVLPVADLDERGIAAMRLTFPLVVKPVRGRGSEGVTRVSSIAELVPAIQALLGATVSTTDGVVPRYGSRVIVEAYLPGVETTVTVMPPGRYGVSGQFLLQSRCWCLPPVRRFNHMDGIAPYNGVVAVTRNSRVLAPEEVVAERLSRLLEDCAAAGDLVGIRAPIRIDCRRGRDGVDYLIDVNMKPNLTGPGRPGCDDQDGLSTLAARGIGWTYADLLVNMLRQSWPFS